MSKNTVIVFDARTTLQGEAMVVVVPFSRHLGG